MGLFEAQCREHLLLHEPFERLAQAARGEIAEQADARVGIEALAARRVGRLPLAVVVADLCLVLLHRVGELQRQAAGGIGREVEQADAVEAAALQCRPVLAGAVVETHLVLGQGIAGEGGGEGLAHRADLEQGLRRHPAAVLFRGQPIAEVMRFSFQADGYGQARNVIGLHHRLYGGVDQCLQAIRRGLAGNGRGGGEQQCGSGDAAQAGESGIAHEDWCPLSLAA